MKFSNTKHAFKTVGSDIKVLVKDLSKLGKDVVVGIPKATCDDLRQEYELRREFREWRKARDASSEAPAQQ